MIRRLLRRYRRWRRAPWVRLVWRDGAYQVQLKMRGLSGDAYVRVETDDV